MLVPPWWQTAWFRLLAAASTVCLVLGGVGWRMESLRRQARRLEAQVTDRSNELSARGAELAAITDGLKASESRYRRLVDGFPDGAVVLYDSDLRVVLAGGLGLKLYGLTGRDLEGKVLTAIIPPALAELLAPVIDQTRAAATPRQFDLPYASRMYSLIVEPQADTDGTVGGGLLIAQDITDRFTHEQAIGRLNMQLEQRVTDRTRALTDSLRALNASQRFSERLAETSPAMLLVFDLTTRQIVYSNHQQAAVAGSQASDAAADSAVFVGELPRPDDVVELLAGRDRFEAMANGEVADYEARLRHADGDLRWYAVRASVFQRGREDQVTQVLVAALDITKRRRLEDDLRTFQRQAIKMQDAERAHIARELHDQIGQLLTGLNYTLAAASSDGTAGRGDHIAKARQLVLQITTDVRRLSVALRPAMLDGLGLLPTLAWHVQQFQEQTGIAVRFEHDGLAAPVTPEAAITAFRLVQEALTNIARHAGVGMAMLRLWATDGRLHVEVVDRGRGFNPSLVQPGSSGLPGMRERLKLVGGTFVLDSYPGSGTKIHASLPLSGNETEQSKDLHVT